MANQLKKKGKMSFGPIAGGILMGLLLAVAISTLTSQAQEITILHTNDIHGSYLSREADWRDDRPLVGGMEALAGEVRATRADVENLLLLDGGDVMTGHPICDLVVDDVHGGGLIKIMNALQYDAMTLGNHDLDISQENVHGLEALADFPFLCCNLVYEDGRGFLGKACVIKRVGKLRVGIIGVITEFLAGVVQKKNIEGLKILDPLEQVQALADSLDSETDLIILLSHMGVEADRELAAKIKNVDVIVGGHSHTRIKEPEVVGDVLIVQAGGRLTQVGRLDLTVKHDRVVAYKGRLIDLWIEGMEPQEDIRRMVQGYEEAIGETFGEVLGELKVAWTRDHYSESNLGDWVSDILRVAGAGDFAVMNSGGLRKDMPPGPIHRLDIYEILPFDNEACRFTCTGEELMTMIRHNAQGQAFQTSGILQVSGLSYSFRSTADGGVEIINAMVNGKPIKPKQTYTGISVDFVVISQAENYLRFKPSNVVNLGYKLNELAVQAVRDAGILGEDVQGRMQQLTP
ncbi:MAG: bifunctional metallophosphatase/5'-nucleotidase [Candidatus Eisenbacteria bacterium]|uniref:Bifunctional metallophosphatase/5'-nucleotidase n=1 Tax=Eiseniibacteriota bacterium TaxID=2212470 RepID=A0A948RYC8_UNCEI|nr:bifunctional metallophosphatase/5'-nucleotidase [Candidatus Eisenbacteria bacterium]MBU2690499.1 bifunctional metallophosphatase/5'-nucleotidase [Candidatus Eisenbacteria bacterium]